MSDCIYYRRGACVNSGRCRDKLLARDGKITCQRNGDLGWPKSEEKDKK